MHKFEISYYTTHLEVPFAYGLHIAIQKKLDYAQVVMEIQYSGREHMKEEELEQWGFSLNDDMTLECRVPLLWWDHLNALYDSSEKYELNEEEDTNLIISYTDEEEDRMEVPENIPDWEILLQELQQAVMEVCQKELPLQLTYRICAERTAAKEYTLLMKFENREALIQHDRNSVTKSWDDTRDMLELLYAQDFQYDKASEKTPEKPGEWLRDTDGGWYKMYKDIKNSSPNDDNISKIKNFFIV